MTDTSARKKNIGQMSKELTKEQLLEYVKKQKLKIKKLESDLAEAQANSANGSSAKEDTTSLDSANLAELKAELVTKDEEIESLSNLVHDREVKLTRSKNEFDAKISLWQSEKEALESQVKALQLENQNFRSSVEEWEQEASVLQTKLQAAEEAKEKVVQMLQNLKDEYDEVIVQRDTLQSSENSLRAANSELEAIRESYTASAQSDQRLSSMVADLKQQLDNLTSENGRMIETSIQERKEFERHHQEITLELKQKTEELSEKSLEIERLKESVLAIQEEQRTISIDRDSLKVQLVDQLAAFDSEKMQFASKAEEEMNALTEEMHTLKKTMNSGIDSSDCAVVTNEQLLEIQVRNLENELLEAKQDIDKLNTTISEKVSEISDLQNTIAVLKSSSALCSSNSQNSSPVSIKSSESKDGMKTLEEKLHRMKTQYQSSLQRIRDIEGQVSEHEGKHEHLHRKLEASNSRIVELEEQLKLAGERNAELESEVELTKKDSAASYELENEKIRNTFVEQIDNAQKAAEATVQSIQQQLAESRGEVDNLQKTVAELNEAHRQALHEKEAQVRLVDAMKENLQKAEKALTDSADVDEKWKTMLSDMELQLLTLKEKETASSQRIQQLEHAVEEEKAAYKKLDTDSTERISEFEELVKSMKEKLASQESAATSNLSEQLETTKQELETTRRDAQEKDDKVKKAIAKLKQKMKENDELSQQLEQLKKEFVDTQAKLVLAERHQQELQVQLQVLRSDHDSISKRTQESEGAKIDFEQRLKALNDALLASEERLSAILLEKNKLRDEQLSLERNLSAVQSQAEILKNDKESQLRRIKELEGREHEFVVRNNELQQLSEQLKSANGSLTNEVNHYRQTQANLAETDHQLKQQLELSTRQTQQMSELQEKMEKERAEFIAKEEALNDRVKKLKGLLAKVNQASQEKETKLNQLELKRPKRFLVLARISIKTSQSSRGNGTSEEDEHWALILPDAPPSDDAGTMTQRQQRWIEESTLQEWLSQGSSIIGTTPENLTEQWSHRYRTMQQSLERERDDLKAQLEDISQQFSTYKVRAQTALKRIGTDDKERQKQKELEQREMDELRQATSAAERQIEEHLATIKNFEAEVESLNAALSSTRQEHSKLEKDTLQLHEQIQTLKGLQSDKEETIEQLQTQLAQRDNETRRLQGKVESLTREIEEARLMTNHVSIAEPVLAVEAAATSNHSLNSGLKGKVHDAIHHMSPSQSHSQLDSAAVVNLHSHSHEQGSATFQQHRPPSLQISHLNVPPSTPMSAMSMTPSTMQQNSKFLVHQQADHLLRENIHILREENSTLNLELSDLRNDISLRDEQIAMLKSTVRELEATLMREQEFNQSHRHINAEYLVNVMRKFLLAMDASERYKLVGVLCQMLHLQPEETRLINERWAVRGGGLVGWLLPPKPSAVGPPVSGSSDATSSSMAPSTPGKKASTEAPALDAYSGMGININPY